MKKIILAFSVLAILFSSCKKNDQRATEVPESVFSYVYAYTSGTVSRSAPVKVQFVNDVIGENHIGKEADTNLLNISPSVKGKLIWENRQTLRFQPSGVFDAGKIYIATVNLKSLFQNIPSDAKSFEFDFRTRDLNFTVEQGGFRAKSINDLSIQEYQGEVNTTDVADNILIEKIISATQNGKSLPIRWMHAENGINHTFFIEEIKRVEQDGQLEIHWEGKPLALETSDNINVEIPGLSNFKVTQVEVVQANQQYIKLNFSDPLKKTQNLDGLIRLSGYSGKLKFTIEGNEVLIYPTGRITGKRKILVDSGIKNITGRKMANQNSWELSFEEEKPQVRIVGKGVILPNNNGLFFPFEAINLDAVEVEVFKIFNNNVLQYLQRNNLDGSSDLHRVGRVVHQEKIDLRNLNANPNKSDWTRYALDLSRMISQDPSAIYQIRIGFRKGYSSYHCAGENTNDENLTVAFVEENVDNGEFTSIWDTYYGLDGYYDNYEYNDRENPCKSGYYNDDNFAKRNVIASDLGIIAKRGTDNTVFVTVSDLRSTDPVSGATLEFYDYQQQLLKTVNTDSEGVAITDLERPAYMVVAKRNEEKGYLRMDDGRALSMSRFDVSGTVSQKGLKGFIYGERGVWRPGDSLFLNFIIEDKASSLPSGHPVNFTLFDPRGQVQEKRTVFENTNGIYALHTKTDSEAPTGNYRAEVKLGGATFTKTIKIETVKPNRLKVDLDFGKEVLTSDDLPRKVAVQANWLHGAPAQNLETKIEMQVSEASLKFPKFSEFRFKDPARNISDTEPQTVFEGNVNADGKASFDLKIFEGDYAPGKLRAKFKSRVFEKGGDFSTRNSSVEYHPYTSYAGIRIPKNSWGSKRLDIDKPGSIEFAIADIEGNPVSGRKVSVGLYRVDWSWWWESSRDNVSRYSSSDHVNAKETTNLVTQKDGTVKWTTTIKEWGRYMVRVCDEETGHCSGDYFYAGYPWYDDDNNGNNREGATMLAFSATQEKYKVGETVQINVPANDVSRVLVTLETGSKVVQSFWRDAKKGENTFTFTATEEMSPTVYAHVALIQPHAQTENDLPIRMYGVVPINVENPVTQLKPELQMPDELKPEQEFMVQVKEKSGKPMAYTLAIVDDGLLDLTNFKTPNPHASFYAREALGVQTFDVYDYVVGAYGGDMSRILSVGGDDAEGGKKGGEKANRFKPVVRHIGPFYLKAGATANHKITMPNYVGSVRTMVVAANTNASYGRTEKTTPVRKPLMVLATLPRVLGPGETLSLPISVFAMDKKVKNAKITIEETSGLVGIGGEPTQNLSFSKIGEKLANFDLKVSENIGVARFKITAKGAGEVATQEIEIQVRNPNPYVTNVDSKLVQAGENWEVDFQPLGMAGTNEAILEISNLPPIDLGRRLRYLIHYPYGCVEQTTSSGFPQLYVNRLIELDENQKSQIPENVQATVDRLKNFQTASGGFAYWPGQADVNQWGNNYAGHFILEAEKLGYVVPSGLKNRWIKSQSKLARNYDPRQADDYYYRGSELTQAYRLYTLSLANAPEMGAMNRLRETKTLDPIVKWRLAAAYAAAGKPEVARSLTNSLNTNVKPYRELGNTFGSSLRDKSMILETLTLLGEREKAAELVKTMSEELSSGRWLSTQETSYALLAIGKYIGENDISSDFNFAYQIGNRQEVNAGSNNPLMNVNIPVSGTTGQKVSLKNTSKGILYARLISSGQPVTGDQTAAADKLKIAVKYLDSEGKSMSPTRISQGTDFVAEVTISHPGGAYQKRYDELALDQIFPSGWEILNTRMDNFSETGNADQPEYQDIRDDRVYSFFDLRYGKSKTFRIQLNAAYQGRYYLPTIACSAMYDESIHARVPGVWVDVVGADAL